MGHLGGVRWSGGFGGLREGQPLADDHAQGGGEAFTAESLFLGELFDDGVITGFEVDLAGDILDRHVSLLRGG